MKSSLDNQYLFFCEIKSTGIDRLWKHLEPKNMLHLSNVFAQWWQSTQCRDAHNVSCKVVFTYKRYRHREKGRTLGVCHFVNMLLGLWRIEGTNKNYSLGCLKEEKLGFFQVVHSSWKFHVFTLLVKTIKRLAISQTNRNQPEKQK